MIKSRIEMGSEGFQPTSLEILKQSDINKKISRIAELRKKLHERLEAEKSKKIEISEEQAYHRLYNLFMELAEKDKLTPDEINQTYMKIKGVEPIDTEAYYLNPKTRGDLPAVLSQLTRKEGDPEDGCGWCGWLLPAEDELGALAYCTQHGSACPECRSTEWNNLEKWRDVDDAMADAMYRGATPSEALTYALHWSSYRGNKISSATIRYTAEAAKIAYEIEQKRSKEGSKEIRKY